MRLIRPTCLIHTLRQAPQAGRDTDTDRLAERSEGSEEEAGAEGTGETGGSEVLARDAVRKLEKLAHFG